MNRGWHGSTAIELNRAGTVQFNCAKCERGIIYTYKYVGIQLDTKSIVLELAKIVQLVANSLATDIRSRKSVRTV